MSKRYDQTELDDLKSRTKLSAIFAKYGVKSKGSESARWANCCFHGDKTPSLKIDDIKGRYHCFGCGADGDHFTVLQERGGESFAEAIEVLGGVRLITVEERKIVEDQAKKWKDEEDEKTAKVRKSIKRTFDAAPAIDGTMAAEYLQVTRSLPVVPQWTFDLRFVAELPYRGFATADAEEQVELGAFPAMVAAIRGPDGKIIGLHRTYLDREAPIKLTPPGDPARNKAKKVLGEQRGGTIRLSADRPQLVVGEGIETTRAWYALGLIEEGDFALAAAVSLGNMSGGAMGSAPHPADPNKRVPNGSPDMDRPGMLLPPVVREVILLGDGDSDPAMTRARLLVAGRRFRALGLAVSVHMAPSGLDFADLLAAEAEAA